MLSHKYRQLKFAFDCSLWWEECWGVVMLLILLISSNLCFPSFFFFFCVYIQCMLEDYTGGRRVGVARCHTLSSKKKGCIGEFWKWKRKWNNAWVESKPKLAHYIIDVCRYLDPSFLMFLKLTFDWVIQVLQNRFELLGLGCTVPKWCGMSQFVGSIREPIGTNSNCFKPSRTIQFCDTNRNSQFQAILW